jgi:hypothetical protein
LNINGSKENEDVKTQHKITKDKIEPILEREEKNIPNNENFKIKMIVNKPHEKLHLT